MEFLGRASPLQWGVLRRPPRQNQRETWRWWGHHHRYPYGSCYTAAPYDHNHMISYLI